MISKIGIGVFSLNTIIASINSKDFNMESLSLILLIGLPLPLRLFIEVSEFTPSINTSAKFDAFFK